MRRRFQRRRARRHRRWRPGPRRDCRIPRLLRPRRRRCRMAAPRSRPPRNVGFGLRSGRHQWRRPLGHRSDRRCHQEHQVVREPRQIAGRNGNQGKWSRSAAMCPCRIHLVVPAERHFDGLLVLRTLSGQPRTSGWKAPATSIMTHRRTVRSEKRWSQQLHRWLLAEPSKTVALVADRARSRSELQAGSRPGSGVRCFLARLP